MTEASGTAALTLAGLGPYLTILVAAALPTHIWRWLGVLLAGRVDEGSEIFVWVKAVATALVAAVISKLLLFPTGALGEAPVALRLGAAAAGFAVFIGFGKRLGLGIVTAEIVLIGGWLLLVA